MSDKIKATYAEAAPVGDVVVHLSGERVAFVADAIPVWPWPTPLWHEST